MKTFRDFLNESQDDEEDLPVDVYSKATTRRMSEVFLELMDLDKDMNNAADVRIHEGYISLRMWKISVEKVEFLMSSRKSAEEVDAWLREKRTQCNREIEKLYGFLRENPEKDVPECEEYYENIYMDAVYRWMEKHHPQKLVALFPEIRGRITGKKFGV
jgi:hypothetical protein